MTGASSDGINLPADVFQGRAKALDIKPQLLDIGEIQPDMSLITNKFPLPIPQKDYLVCRSVQWGKADDIFYHTQYPDHGSINNSGEHIHGMNGEHPHGGAYSSNASYTEHIGTDTDGKYVLDTDAISAYTDEPSGEHTHPSDPPPMGTHNHPETEGLHKHGLNKYEMQHVHDTLIGDKFRWLEPGDRVLVAWVGDDACVIDLVYPATRIGRNADSYEKE